MATLKIKFRPSKVDGGEGTIFYQIIHNRRACQHRTGYRLYGEEWNKESSRVVLPDSDVQRRHYLELVGEKIGEDIKRFRRIIAHFECRCCDYSAEDVVAKFSDTSSECYLFAFMEELIVELKALGKVRTSETYAAALSSFRGFRQGRDISIEDINSEVALSYETYLRDNGVSPNTSSFYMRNLRAAYNRAVERELTSQRFPFKYVYTGVDKTIKRAVPIKVIKDIKALNLSRRPALDLARDMFLFSFFTRGMSFVDMAYLRKRDLNAGILTYRRHKTGQRLFIHWERCMQSIVDKYANPHSIYLLPLIDSASAVDERKQYIYAAHKVNRALKIIGTNMGLPTPLTMYVARHAWASIAKSIPLSVISEAMGHNSEATTRIYLASLDRVTIDKANRIILNAI